jgi:hypothetical protein
MVCIERKLSYTGLNKQISSMPVDIFVNNMTFANVARVMPFIMAYVSEYKSNNIMKKTQLKKRNWYKFLKSAMYYFDPIDKEKFFDPYKREIKEIYPLGIKFYELFDILDEEEKNFYISIYETDPEILLEKSMDYPNKEK